MFGELPKLFDKNFAIAYFLPAAGFVAISYLILVRFGLTPHLTISTGTFLTDLAGFGSLSLLGGIILLILNRGVVRLLEGYWPLNLGKRLNRLERWRFRRLKKRSDLTRAQIQELEKNNQPTDHLLDQWDKLQKRKANRFPHEERLVLPTSFGNTYRAFESYPRVMYGINAIPGWFRLLAVIPKEYRETIDSARARVDFWVNSCFLSLVVIVEYYVVGIYAERVKFSTLLSPHGRFPWIPSLALVGFVMAYFYARSAAGEWGNWVKSAFDLYLPDLRTKLGFTPAANKKAESQTWVNFNISVLTREPAWMPSKIIKKTEEAAAMEIVSLEVRKLNDQESLLSMEAVVPNKPGEAQEQAVSSEANKP